MLRSATFVYVIVVFVGTLDRIKVSLFQIATPTAPEHNDSGVFYDMR